MKNLIMSKINKVRELAAGSFSREEKSDATLPYEDVLSEIVTLIDNLKESLEDMSNFQLEWNETSVGLHGSGRYMIKKDDRYDSFTVYFYGQPVRVAGSLDAAKHLCQKDHEKQVAEIIGG